MMTILSMSLGGTMMACLLLLLQRLFQGRLPSAFYYYAWLLVLLRFILPLPGLMPALGSAETTPTVTVQEEVSDIRTYPTQIDRTQRIQIEDEGYVQDTVTESPATERASVQAETPETLVTLQDTAVPRSQTAFQGVAAIKAFLTSGRFWLGLWMMGAAASVLWYGLGYGRFSCALRNSLLSPRWSDQQVYQTFSLSRRPRLARSRCVDTPMLLGVIHPLLVIPDRDYDPVTLTNILRHELTHHRRGDIVYKWFAVLVFSLHWFNPCTYWFRRELDRVCELSCDEQLLRHMTAGEKQNYGETLLDLAAEHALPRSVVATTFATEKRTLKERLVQIMTYKHRGRKTIALVMAAVLVLCTCGAVMGPKYTAKATADAAAPEEIIVDPTPTPVETFFSVPQADTIAQSPSESEAVPTPTPILAGVSPAYDPITVSTVDEFLAAIGPGNTICLEPGTYDLSTASNYGTAQPYGWYTWEEVADGYELVIQNVTDLTITGTATADVTIAAVPRYADVISFRDCKNISLLSLTAGHTPEPSQCAGGVIDLSNSSSVVIQDTSLYGCGVVGVRSGNSSNIQVLDSTIYECSSGAVEASSSTNLRIENCEVYDCGTDINGMLSGSLFNLRASKGVAILNNRIYKNLVSTMVSATSTSTLYFLGNDVYENQFDVLFSADIYSPVVSDCSFRDNQFDDAYDSIQTAVLPDGTKLSLEDLSAMTLAATSYDADTMTETIDPVALNKAIYSDGTTEVTVSNVNELLSAIGPNTTIYLEPGDYNLFESNYYGVNVGDYCTWGDYATGIDGLIITGVENLQIIGSGADNTQILTTPREDNVITFQDCDDLYLSGFTVGHTIIPDSTCAGDVLVFRNCDNVGIANCGLFGCGVWGIRADSCQDMTVESTEIYDCSGGGTILSYCRNVAFLDSTIHDCDGPDFQLLHCKNITRDGADVT